MDAQQPIIGAQPGNAQRAMAYLTGQGMAPADAAAMVWNFQQESGKDLNTTLSHDGGTGFGIAGYRDPTQGAGRWTNLRNFAASQNRDPSDLYTQLDFARSELAGPEAATWAKMQAADTPEAKAQAAIGYFRPAQQYADARAARAGEVNALLGGDQQPPQQPAAPLSLTPPQQPIFAGVNQQSQPTAQPQQQVAQAAPQQQQAQPFVWHDMAPIQTQPIFPTAQRRPIDLSGLQAALAARKPIFPGQQGA